MIKRSPQFLGKKSKEFYKKVINAYQLEDHHIKILLLACECLDQIEIARLRIEKEGSYFISRFREPKTHPALKEFKDNKLIFAKLIKQLNLDYEVTDEVGRPGSYSLKKRRKQVIGKSNSADDEAEKAFEKLLD